MPSRLRWPLLILALAGPLVLPAQDLTEPMEALAEAIGEVTIGDDSFDQEWDFDREMPYRITFRRVETDKKGRSTEYLYQFNLADLNERLVSRETSRDQMYVRLRTQGLLQAIKHFEDGEQKAYESEVVVLVNGPEEADVLIDLFQESIPIAVEQDQARIVPDSYEAALEQALGMVGNVSINGAAYEQTLRQDDEALPLLLLEVRAPKGKTVQQTQSRFNLADISDPVSFQVKRDEVQLELRVRGNLKYIARTVDGEPQNYTNAVTLLMEDVEQARDMSKLLNYLIPHAMEHLRASLPESPESEATLQSFSERVGEVVRGGTSYQQSLDAACQTDLLVTETNDKGSTKDHYQFHLSDMNGAQATIEVKGKMVGVSLPATGKARMVTHTRDDAFAGYLAEVFIQADGVENARRMEHLLPAVTQYCKDKLERLPPEGSLEEKMAWANEQLAAYRGPKGEMQQSLLWDAGAPCDLTYETNDGKRTDAYEFRLQDMGTNKLAMAISPKKLAVELGTAKGEDLIKYYRDGEMKRFTKAFSMELDNIAIARGMMLVFAEAIETCQE